MKKEDYKNTDGDLQSLKQLTLLVPTRDRNYYLSRWLWHTSRFPFGKIIIADSSSDEKKQINQDIIRQVVKITGANIYYIACIPESDPIGGDIFRKWGVGLQYVDTGYCKMCTDKEFVLPNAMVECVDYLSHHPDYVAAQGVVYTALNTSTPLSPNTYYLKFGYPARRAEHSSSSLERFEDAFVGQKSWNNNMLVAVARTEINQYLYQLLDEYDIPGIRYAEVLLGYVGYLMGKYYYSEKMDFSIIDFVLRNNPQFNVPDGQGTTESAASRYPYFNDYIKMGVSKSYYDRYKHCMHDQLKRFAGLSPDDADNYIQSVLTQKLLNHYGMTIKNPSVAKSMLSQINKRYNVVNRWSQLPLSLRKRIQPVMSQMLNINLSLERKKDSKSYSPEISDVLDCIENTLVHHEYDTPLYESPFNTQ